MKKTKRSNVLSHLPSNENAVSSLLRALCVLKPIRETVVRLFTNASYGADDVEFEGISTQCNIGGAIPDMCFQSVSLRAVVEIKVSNWQNLTTNQPQTYLQWLMAQHVDHKYFIFLVPPRYIHRQIYESRKADFCAANPNHGIHFIEITWLDLSDVLDESGLSATSVYARDFQNMLEEWYVPTPITFTFNQLSENSMFNTDVGDALCRLFELVDELSMEFELAGFTVSKYCPRRWWAEEWGMYIKCGNNNVLYLGIWPSFWQAHGYPLCIGVNPDNWAPPIVARFQQMFQTTPGYFTFVPDGHPFLTKGIEQQYLLGDNAVQDISSWLLQGYLNQICDFFNNNP